MALTGANPLVTRLKKSDPSRFRTMCVMHLSFHLDLDGSALEDFMADADPAMAGDKAVGAKSGKKSNFPHFGRKKSKGDRNEMMSPHLDFECVENIEVLLRFLARPENLKLEGLFRKTGQLQRQRVLRDKLVSGESLETELLSGTYSAHDCANLLKNFLGELAEPLLTERHFPIYSKIPEMIPEHTSPQELGFREQRQLETVQLLVQLLPRENAALLRALLSLLHQVAQTDGNLMTAETLGTMFAPHLLFPRRMSPSELQQKTPNATKAAAYLIEKAPDVFKVPQHLLQDIVTYWAQMEDDSDARLGGDDHMDAGSGSSHQRYRKNNAETEAIHTSVTFVDRSKQQDITECELTKLYQQFNKMSEGDKRKYFKRLNRTGMISHTPTSKHKRSKSLGESIKKMVTRSNHKRRGSGHSAQVHAVNMPLPGRNDQSLPQQAQDPMPIVVEHTPIIRAGGRPTATCTPLTPASTCTLDSPTPSLPIARLFKDTDKPILPCSPVHIVNLNPGQQPSPAGRLLRPHRHFESPPVAPSPTVLRTRRPLSTSARATPLSHVKTPSSSTTSSSRPLSAVTFSTTPAATATTIPTNKSSSSRYHHSTPTTSMKTPVSIMKPSDRNNNTENMAPPVSVCKWTARSSKSPHAPVIVTPDRRFEKASSSCVQACLSPITHSITKAPTQVKAMLMTPGSRRPMSVLQSP